jgi:hypothetical protein
MRFTPLSFARTRRASRAYRPFFSDFAAISRRCPRPRLRVSSGDHGRRVTRCRPGSLGRCPLV